MYPRALPSVVAAARQKGRVRAAVARQLCSESILAAVCSARDHLVVARDERKRNVLAWRFAAGYGWSIVVRELQASPRWSPRAKARAGVLVGVAISGPVTFGVGLPYVYWLLTGRGPWQRYGFSSTVVVNPLRRRIPAESRAALADLQKEHAGEFVLSRRARP